jgi:starvation-inducible DNA-binding protein
MAAVIDFSIDSTIGSPTVTRLTTSETQSYATVTILQELLAQSIHLRDLYKTARRQTADVQHCQLHQLFDFHYKEQIRLVDVLIDRIRMLGGRGSVFAGDFVNDTQCPCPRLGRKATFRLVGELLDAHESVLNTAQPTRVSGDHKWARDFAIGQVVLTNDQQSWSLSEQLVAARLRKEFFDRLPTENIHMNGSDP